MKITFLGGGNMASALIGGLQNHGIPPGEIAVIEINAENRARLEREYRVRCYAEPDPVSMHCDALVLAVKPQQMRDACLAVKKYLKTQLVISIAAGLRLDALSRWLGGYDRLVRAMPNTPALISSGVTGLYALPSVSEAERLGAERVLNAVGSTVWVNLESQIDAVTAISGSGPAYVFLFIEALQQAAMELGFTPKQARQLSIETTLGAARLAAQSEEPASVLRERVTSKGGTTYAALQSMEAAGVAASFEAAMRAAEQRAHELGDEFGS